MAGHPRTDTRSRIMEVALELFGEGGFEGTSLQDIADRLGLTKAALYYHFRSKDELLAAIVGPVFDDLETRLDGMDQARPTVAARRAATAEYLDYLIAHRDVIGFLTRDLALLTHPAVADRALAARSRVDVVLMGRDQGPVDRIVATMALSALQGAIVVYDAAQPDVFRETVLLATEAVIRSGRRRNAALSG